MPSGSNFKPNDLPTLLSLQHQRATVIWPLPATTWVRPVPIASLTWSVPSSVFKTSSTSLVGEVTSSNNTTLLFYPSLPDREVDKYIHCSSSVAYGDDSIIPSGRPEAVSPLWRCVRLHQRSNHSLTLMTYNQPTKAKARRCINARSQRQSLALRGMNKQWRR